MRRPLLIIFIVLLMISFIYTNLNTNSEYYYNEEVSIVGTVKYKKVKDKYDEYIVGNFLVRDYTKTKDIRIGRKIKLNGKLKDLNNMSYDNFNYGRYLRSVGYEGLIYIENYKVLGNNKIYEALYKVKYYMSSTLRYLYKTNSDFLNSVMLGQKEDLSQDENLMFSTTGTSHIIAISGLHTGILSALIIFVIGRINKVYKLILLSIIMLLYSIMVGNSPSILRSIMFMIILYLGFFLERKDDKISTLSFIGILLVVNNPYIIYNISFQLSFLATLSIIYFYGFINNKLKIKLISLTLASNILTIPIIYYNFKGIPLISVLSNMVIVPFIAIIIYLAILSLILFKVNIHIAKIIASINKFILDTIYILLDKFSNLEFAYITIKEPKLYYVIIYYIIVFSYMIYKEVKTIKEQKNELQGYYQ